MKRHRQLDEHLQQQHVGPASQIDSENTNAEPTPLTGCWCISKGMAGMNSQTSGLARAIGFEFEFRHCQLKFPWKLLPLQIIPRTPSVLRDPSALAGEPPRLVVSCGRQGVIPALTLKKQYGDRVFAVHIQDPTINTKDFDLVVVPEHDGTRGDNVYVTTGAPHYVTPEKLAEAARSPESDLLTDGSKPLVTVLLGGKNGYYSFRDSDVTAFVDGLKRLVVEHGARLAVLKSRRTPTEVAERIQNEFGDTQFVWDGEGSNPYFAGLAKADYFVVTGDSVSMISEAVSTGRPVFVQHLTEDRAARRFRLFHQQFERAGFTRPFEGRLDDWSYTPPNDTPQVAELIRERMGIA
jgi:mitochondrial fission protein ELM1